MEARAAAREADRIEAIAFIDLYDAAPAALKSRLGLAVETVADATLLLAPGMPAAMFNRAIGLGLERAASVADVEAIVRTYGRAGAKSWWLHWNPFALPADLVGRLPALGFSEPARKRWAKVMRSTASPPAPQTSLAIVPTADDQAEATTRAIVSAFELPPFVADWLAALQGRPRWRLYSALDGSTVVGGGALFVDGDAGWLGMGAILPSHRRRGGQGTLMARRIADAGRAGAGHAFTETGEPVGDEPNPSLANMKRCGFEVVASRMNYVGPEDIPGRSSSTNFRALH